MYESSSCSTSLLAFSIVILVSMWWYLTVGLISIFLMTKNIEHVTMCLFAIHTSSIVKCLFKSSIRSSNFFVFITE